MEKTLKDVLKIIQAIRFQGDSVERLDVAADILINRLDHPIELEKTITEKESSVLEYCQEVCPTNGQIRRFQGWHLINHGGYWSAHHTSGECIFTTKKPSGGESGIFYKYHLAYAVCGLDKRDALEAERGKSAKLIEALEKINNVPTKRQESIDIYKESGYQLKTDSELVEKIAEFGFGELEFHTADIERLVTQSGIAFNALEAYKEGKKDE